MRRTSRPRQQDHALPVLAPQRRGAGSLFSKKLIHAQNSDRSRVLYPQYPVCVIPYRQKPPPEHMRPASSAASGSKTSRRPSAIAARRIFRPLPDGCAERCNIVRRHVECRPLRNKKRGRRLTRPSHRLGDRIPPFRIPYRQDCGHRTRPARTIPGGDSRRPMYPVEIIS